MTKNELEKEVGYILGILQDALDDAQELKLKISKVYDRLENLDILQEDED